MNTTNLKDKRNKECILLESGIVNFLKCHFSAKENITLKKTPQNLQKKMLKKFEFGITVVFGIEKKRKFNFLICSF